ncbi:MAG: Sec-independent protein translocase subunit TatB [Betaproteobacteria bacterium]|nr:Sec-independent protein translocase subunit TatB [Betaproteobacteria bacterium]
MFDIGFTELMVIAVVALVVIGPEKLPKVARTVGAYLGRLQRYVNDVKADINREIELDELRRFKQTVEDTARNFESSVQSEVSGAESAINKVTEGVTEPLSNLDPLASNSAPSLAAEPGPSATGFDSEVNVPIGTSSTTTASATAVLPTGESASETTPAATRAA